jgi:phosphoribosylformylglycinamidine synthase
MCAAFRARDDTFALGVCNGCQLLALLGWVPGADALALGGTGAAAAAADADARANRLAAARQPRFIENASGKFESRYCTLRVEPGSPCDRTLLKGMGGSVLGVWIAHGEGRLHFPDPAVADAVWAGGLAPLRYADDRGDATEEYPFNPNGSPRGAAALCSADGRCLALMPHPERSFRLWQCPWLPPAWRDGGIEAAPWLRLFQARRMSWVGWCSPTPDSWVVVREGFSHA